MARGKSAIHLAVRAVPRARARKSAKAVTVDVLPKLLATCASDNLRDLRDKAILMMAFASGGRRRSEIARLRVEQLTIEPPIEMPDRPPPSLVIHLGRTKTATGGENDTVYLTGRPVDAQSGVIFKVSDITFVSRKIKARRLCECVCFHR